MQQAPNMQCEADDLVNLGSFDSLLEEYITRLNRRFAPGLRQRYRAWEVIRYKYILQHPCFNERERGSGLTKAQLAVDFGTMMENRSVFATTNRDFTVKLVNVNHL
jgi:hypothetical protein